MDLPTPEDPTMAVVRPGDKYGSSGARHGFVQGGDQVHGHAEGHGLHFNDARLWVRVKVRFGQDDDWIQVAVVDQGQIPLYAGAS